MCVHEISDLKYYKINLPLFLWDTPQTYKPQNVNLFCLPLISAHVLVIPKYGHVVNLVCELTIILLGV